MIALSPQHRLARHLYRDASIRLPARANKPHYRSEGEQEVLATTPGSKRAFGRRPLDTVKWVGVYFVKWRIIAYGGVCHA